MSNKPQRDRQELIASRITAHEARNQTDTGTSHLGLCFLGLNTCFPAIGSMPQHAPAVMRLTLRAAPWALLEAVSAVPVVSSFGRLA